MCSHSNCEIVPSQEALLKLLDRIFADELDNEGGSAKVMVRMLVDSSQVCPWCYLSLPTAFNIPIHC